MRRQGRSQIKFGNEGIGEIDSRAAPASLLSSEGILIGQNIHAGIDNGSAKQWYYRDGHGSTSAVADNSGAVLEQYEYNAQGQFQITNSSSSVQATTQIANDLLYTGRNYDYETGNYFYRARYYNPSLGRFISRDPLSGAEFSQGTNLYAYCRNNFLNACDPTGMCLLDGKLTAGGYWGPNQYDQTLMSGTLPIVPPPTVAAEAEVAPEVENASTVLDASGLLGGLGSGHLGDNLSLYSDAFHGNQYVDIVADLGKVSEALGVAGTVGAASLDAYSGQYGKAAFDTGLGAAAYAFPEVGGPVATGVAGFNVGNAIGNIPVGSDNTVGGGGPWQMVLEAWLQVPSRPAMAVGDSETNLDIHL